MLTLQIHDQTIMEMLLSSRIHQWGGAAFVLGNLLFIVNKLDEMSRLFLSRWMPDVISGMGNNSHLSPLPHPVCSGSYRAWPDPVAGKAGSA
jgi:hypothetical protein